MKTTVPTLKQIKREWHLIDLKDQTLGRACTQIASLLIGKGKPYYIANLDCGDYVVVINAKQVAVTGNKRSDKIYRHHTGHPGGFREATFTDVQTKDSRRIVEYAVRGMLPKNKLRDPRMKRLKIFAGDKHSYELHLAKEEK
jgi:large subunit ribosomal protein L13